MVQEKNNLFLLSKLFNVRDMGGFKTENGAITKKYKYIRGTAKGEMDETEKEYFYNLGVRIVIDLRYTEETVKTLSPLRDFKDTKYYHVDMMGEFFQMRNAGYVDLSDLYLDLLNDAQPQIKEVFRLFAKYKDEGIYFHCTAGKDRTGVIAMLLFALVGVDKQTIIANYSESYENNKERPGYKKLPPEWVKFVLSEPAYMERTIDFLEQQYGGVHRYLKQIGLTDEQLEIVKSSFLA